MANRYEVIWREIKKSATTKLNAGVKIKCRPAKIPTIVLAVKKIKSAENRAKIALDLGKYGKLQIIREEPSDSLGYITFKLLASETSEML